LAGRTYARLEIEPFGERLLAEGDLDPVYLALHRLSLEPVVLHRWLLAYSCFYSAGVACYAAEREGDAFWSPLETAAANVEPTPFGERWPRGHERRHSRGAQGIRMIADLRSRYGNRPENFIDACRAPTCAEVMKKVESHYLYGRWIGFKIADLLDRVVGHPVSFDSSAIFMFDDPTKAANILYARRVLKIQDHTKVKTRLNAKGLEDVITWMKEQFKGHLAPPLMDRPIGLQECETILCKWKSHLNGHYPDYNDIDEINDGVQSWWEHSSLAKRFLDAMPRRT
jgi:hypothetical protein